MNELLNINEPAKAGQNWMSKKEIAEICGVDDKTIQRVTNEILSLDIDVQAQPHIKKGVAFFSREFFSKIQYTIKKEKQK